MVEVEDMLNDENSYKEKTHRQEVRQRQKERSHVDIDKDAEKVYEDSKWAIYIPKTYAASCKLGQGTSWCTASTESDYYYNMYKDEYGGDYYIVISKSNPNEKYQFHFESGQFMDAKDVEIDIDKFFRNNPQVQKFFADLHKDAIKELIVDGKITIPVSEFMELYRENYHSRDEIDADFIEAALNGDISEWDVSNTKSMRHMFYKCKELKSAGDISNWDVSNVNNMSSMFNECKELESVGDISSWDVSSVNNMAFMFDGCENFNQDLSGWDVSNVNTMSSMFDGCKSFNQDISNWDVSSVTNMQYMFDGCKSFNQDLSNWDVSNVEFKGNAFRYCPIKEEYKPKFK